MYEIQVFKNGVWVFDCKAKSWMDAEDKCPARDTGNTYRIIGPGRKRVRSVLWCSTPDGVKVPADWDIMP